MFTKNAVTAVCACFAMAFASAAHGQSGPCKDPWINQAFQQVYRRAPVGAGTTGECDINRYGNGHWSNYNDLVQKVIQAGTGSHTLPSSASSNPNAALIKRLGPNDLGVTPTGDLINSSGVIVLRQGTYIISQDGNGLIGENSSGIQVRSGDLIEDGAAFLKGYSVQSVGGKKVIKAKVIHS